MFAFVPGTNETMKGSQKTLGGARIAAVLAALAVMLALPLGAAVLDGVLEVRAAYVTVDDGVFELNAQIEYPVNDEIRRALSDGVALYFDLDTRVEKRRRLWFDATVAELTLRRELSWHAVRERYVVHDVSRGDHENYMTLEQALSAIGVIEGWPVITEPQLEPDGSYEISIRASVRRGSMPDAVRAVIWWSDSWHRRTDWYTWPLPR
jgi:hypothetical protein